MKRVALRLGLLAASCLMLVSASIAFGPAPAQAQGLYVQFGPGPRYYDAAREERFCRAAYWHRDWRAMQWCARQGAYGPYYGPYGNGPYNYPYGYGPYNYPNGYGPYYNYPNGYGPYYNYPNGYGPYYNYPNGYGPYNYENDNR